MSANITDIIVRPLQMYYGWLISYHVTIFGITISLLQWFNACIGFGLVLAFIRWLSGGNIINLFFFKGGTGD